MDNWKPKLHYFSPLPPQKGGFIYREQHLNALREYFDVVPIIPSKSVYYPMFILFFLFIPFVILLRFFFLFMKTQEKIIEYIEYDLAAYPRLFFPYQLISNLISGNKGVYRLHEDYENVKFGWLLRFWDNFWLCLVADIIIVHTYEHAKNLWGVNRRKGLVLVSGLVSRKLKTNPNKNLIIMPGFINRWKGHDVAINAMAEVVKEFPKAKLIIAGKPHDKDFFAKMKRTIALLGIEKNVDIKSGYLDRKIIDNMFSKAYLAILPYRSISFSAVMLDCIDWGVPMVTSNIPEFRELCPDVNKFDIKTEDWDTGEPYEGPKFGGYQLAIEIKNLLRNKKAWDHSRKKMAALKGKYDIRELARKEAKLIYSEFGG